MPPSEPAHSTAAAPPASKLSFGAWMALAAALLGWMFDGMEMGLFPLVARPALLELVGSQATDAQIGDWLGAIIAVFLVGAAAGGMLFGWLGDRVGRVKAMVWSVAVYSVFSGLCAFAAAPWHIAVLRFIAALGMGGEWALGVALVMEIWPGSKRPLLAGLIGAAANAGYLVIGFAGLALASLTAVLRSGLADLGLSAERVDYFMGADNSGWRILMLLGASPALLTFLIRLFVPESERWRHAAASAPPARLADIFAPSLLRKTLLGTMLGALALIGTWGSVQWMPSWAGKLVAEEQKAVMAAAADPGAAKAAGDRLATQARSKTQIAMSSGAIVFTILAAFLADWFSRRWAYFGLSLAALLVCQYLFRAGFGFGADFLLWAFLAGGVTASFYGWLPLYLPELFPTRVRATGQGFAFNAGRLLAAGGTLVSGRLLKNFDGDYARMCAVISLVYLVGLVAIWFCPETKGKPLPE
ncbi:MAG: MFS transporter [Pirellulales bacterium]